MAVPICPKPIQSKLFHILGKGKGTEELSFSQNVNPGDMVGAERKNVDFRVSRLLENGISAMLLDNCMRKGKDLFHSKTQRYT